DSRMHMTTGVVMSVIKISVSVKLEEYITPRKFMRYTAAMPRPTAKASTTENSTSGMELVPMVWEENRLRMSLLFMGKPSSFVGAEKRSACRRGKTRLPDICKPSASKRLVAPAHHVFGDGAALAGDVGQQGADVAGEVRIELD